MMLTRYIKESNNLYYAMIIDGKYQLPITVNKSVSQPQYVILSQKLRLYEVMFFNFYETIQFKDYASPAMAKQMFIPMSHVVKIGDEVPDLDG